MLNIGNGQGLSKQKSGKSLLTIRLRLFTLIFNAMEQITIKQKLDAIVCEEILGLKKVLDDEFSSVKNADELILTSDVTSAPIINLYTEDNDPVQYYVKGVKRTDKGYCLELSWAEHGSLDSKYIVEHYLDYENTRWEFIPGELDRLTDTITEILHPEEECYHFDDVQKAAIERFKGAMKELVNTGVLILPNMGSRTICFANAPKGCFFDSFNNLLSTGEYEKIADIDYTRLPCTDNQYDTEFNSDSISLVRKD